MGQVQCKSEQDSSGKGGEELEGNVGYCDCDLNQTAADPTIDCHSLGFIEEEKTPTSGTKQGEKNQETVTMKIVKSERERNAVTVVPTTSSVSSTVKDHYCAMPSPTVVFSDDTALAAVRDQKLTTTEAGNGREMGVTISIAPPEKWSENSDEDMEDGEISGSEEDGGSNSCSRDVPNQSSLGKSGVEKRWLSPQGRDEKILKRRRLEMPCRSASVVDTEKPELYEVESYCTTTSTSSGGNGSLVSKYRVFNFDSSDSSSELSNNEEQFIQQQRMHGSLMLDRKGREDEASDASLLLPLFRAVISSERKKKVEFEDENQKLKTLLAKTSLEKEETFQMLRQSNKKLAEVTEASVVLEKKVEKLNTQLAEKDVFIKNMKKETSNVRSVISRMSKSFDEVQSKDTMPSPPSRPTDGAKIDGKTERNGEFKIKMNFSDGNGSQDFKSAQIDRSVAITSSNSIGNRNHRQGLKDQSKSPLVHISAADEAFILSKLKDLKKWAFSIKDIKRIDGKWKCPECGDSKQTALATAAHARDKHVWKIGAGVNPRFK